MMKNPKTIMGVLLIALLFWWSTYNADKQQQKMRAERLKAEIEMQADSIAKAKEEEAQSENLLGAPELKKADQALELVAAPKMDFEQKVVTKEIADSTEVDTAKEDVIQDPMAAVQARQIKVVNKSFSVVLDNVGAKVRSIIAYTLENKEGEFPELIQEADSGALTISFDKSDFSQVLFAVDDNIPDSIYIDKETTIKFVWQDIYGRMVERLYIFEPEESKFRHATYIKGFKPKLYTLNWSGGMRETEAFPKQASSFGVGGYFFSEVVFNNTYNVMRESPNELTWFNKDQGKSLWVGLRRKYIAAVINWDGESEASIGASHFGKEGRNPGTYKLVISDYIPDDSVAFDFVVLPLVHSQIKAMNQSYEKIIVSGWEWLGADKWFVALCGGVLKLLNAFFALIPNYGIAIILLTLLMKFVTMPLTLKQLRSTRQMQMLKPEIDAIRLKHRANPQKMQEELMACYAKNNVNPFSAMFGCVTMIFQMPIFISLFVVLGRSVELRGASFVGWITDLSAPDIILPSLQIPFLMPQGLAILPFVMAFTTWFQSKQTITDPNQKAMVWMMPIMMLLFSSVMPSGLIVYWIVSNLFAIVQFRILNRDTKKNA